MRVLFIGTGDIGLPSLEWLLSTPKHSVVGVVTQPDKPVGRKQVLTPPQIKVRALAAGLTVMQPLKIRHAVEELKAFNADVAVVIAYGQILSRAVLDVPPLGCLNVHTSLLPRHRGAAPIQAAIRDGDTETGVTIMFMDEGLDTGDILLMHRMPIAADDTGGSLHDKLALQAPAALEEALDLLATGHPPREKQDESKVTHVRKLTRQDGRLDWTRPAIELDRLVRAFTPWPGTSCLLKEAQMKIHKAQVEVSPNINRDLGMQIYLREIGKVAAMTPEQEVELAERIKRGDPEARSDKIRTSLRLVVKLAQEYANCGLPMLNVISAGNIGLIKAVERFDPKTSGRLSAYAAWWIKRSIESEVCKHSETARLSPYLMDKISRMQHISMETSREADREPTDDELSEESRFLAADVCPAPGTIVSANADGILVSCGSDLLNLLEVQIEGGKRLPAADFLRGHPLQAGDVLG